MNNHRSKQIVVILCLFIVGVIFISFVMKNYFLSATSLLIGISLIFLARSSVGLNVDERELAVREKAAQMTYIIFAPTIGFGAFLLLIPSLSGLSVFSRGEFEYLESLGVVLMYLSLFLITVYVISYYFLSHKYGGKE